MLPHHRAGHLVTSALVRPRSSVAPVRAVAAQAAKLDDPTIIAIFDAANTWDMETGALAAKKGTTKEVRDFGAMLVRDHRAVRQQGRDLVKKLGVHPTPPKDFAMAKDHAAALQTLQSAKRQGVRPRLPRARGGVPQGGDRRGEHDAAPRARE